MNTKKKNKNRPKPPKIQQQLNPADSDKQESLPNVTTELEVESEKKEDLVVVSPVSDAELIKDEKITKDEAPKKPERGKGKKKQEPQYDDTKDMDENKLANDMQLSIEDSQESLMVTPKARKKKNKEKKHNEIQEISKVDIDIIEKIDCKEDTDKLPETKDSVENNPQVDKKQETDSKIMKKKKKKRNRFDSEKSDVIESMESEKELLDHEKSIPSKITLLDDSNVTVSKKEDTDISTDTGIVETTTIQNLNQSENEENSKSKKKNKKQKQLQQKTEDGGSKNELNLLVCAESKQDADCVESRELSSFDETASKAKGTKSKDRKRKVVPDKQSTASDKPNEGLPNITTTLDNKTSLDSIVKPIADTKEQGNVDKIIPEILDKEKVEEEIPSTLDEVLLDNNQTLDDFSETAFMEVKPTKKKKKQSQKSIVSAKEQFDTKILTTAIASIDSDQNVPEKSEKVPKDKENSLSLPPTEEVQDKGTVNETAIPIIAVPDIIQYPRSASQQLLLDNSNNTIIKEILQTSETNVEIPICTSIPIIMGSGETPEIESPQDPLRIKLTEIDSKLDKCVQEKTDIKSKMMEVNQDMEELRLSIERSLAELTALDKGDKEFEKAQEKKLSIDDKATLSQSQMINFPMPTFLVDKPAISSENKDTTPELNKRICISPLKESFASKENKDDDILKKNPEDQTILPVCPSRKDNKGKGKSKKKNKQEIASCTASSTSQQITSDKKTEEHSSTKKETENSEQKQKETQKEGKQQSLSENLENNVPLDDISHIISATNFEPIEKFEDALTSSVDDVNQSFEMIASEATEMDKNFDNPQINIIAPTEDEGKEKDVKENPVTPPKNLLGHPDIPVPSNKTDYKKEKNKTPNNKGAKVKIKDSVEIEKTEKISKQSQTYNKRNNLKNLHGSESFSYMTNGSNEYIYKYSFRKVYLQNFCVTCKKNLTQRFPCKFCSLIFYCSQKHMDENWSQHQPLCFAVSTISHLKGKK